MKKTDFLRLWRCFKSYLIKKKIFFLDYPYNYFADCKEVHTDNLYIYLGVQNIVLKAKLCHLSGLTKNRCLLQNQYYKKKRNQSYWKSRNNKLLKKKWWSCPKDTKIYRSSNKTIKKANFSITTAKFVGTVKISIKEKKQF